MKDRLTVPGAEHNLNLPYSCHLKHPETESPGYLLPDHDQIKAVWDPGSHNIQKESRPGHLFTAQSLSAQEHDREQLESV